MMFMAKELHMSLEQLMQMSTLELTMWYAFYNMEGKKRNARMRQHGSKYSR